MIWDVIPGQIRHRGRSLVRDPTIVFAAMPRRVSIGPAMGDITQELQSKLGRRWVKRQNLSTAGRLMPYGLARGQDNRVGIAESANPTQASKVMVEGAILLRQDHDVLDVLDRAGTLARGKRQRAIDALRKRSRNRGGAEKAEKVAATSICHSQGLGVTAR